MCNEESCMFRCTKFMLNLYLRGLPIYAQKWLVAIPAYACPVQIKYRDLCLEKDAFQKSNNESHSKIETLENEKKEL